MLAKRERPELFSLQSVWGDTQKILKIKRIKLSILSVLRSLLSFFPLFYLFFFFYSFLPSSTTFYRSSYFLPLHAQHFFRLTSLFFFAFFRSFLIQCQKNKQIEIDKLSLNLLSTLYIFNDLSFYAFHIRRVLRFSDPPCHFLFFTTTIISLALFLLWNSFLCYSMKLHRSLFTLIISLKKKTTRFILHQHETNHLQMGLLARFGFQRFTWLGDDIP